MRFDPEYRLLTDRQVWAGVIWLVVMGVAGSMLWNHRYAAGESATQYKQRLYEQVSGEAVSAKPPRTYRLVVVAHPKCPCTSTSLVAARRLADELRGRLAIQVLLYAPTKRSQDWLEAPDRLGPQDYPEFEFQTDVDGIEAAALAAKTSGQTYLFDPAGRLVFQGGLTAGRGYIGNSIGQEEVRSIVLDETQVTTVRSAPVFGCALSLK